MRGQNGSHAKVLDCSLDDDDDGIASGMIFMSLYKEALMPLHLLFQSGFQEMSSPQFAT